MKTASVSLRNNTLETVVELFFKTTLGFLNTGLRFLVIFGNF